MRLATSHDAAAVARLLHDFNIEFDTPTPSLDVLRERLERLLTRADVFVIFSPVALGLVTLRPSPWYAGPVALLEELYVRPDHRGNGLGTRLLSDLMDHARSRGAEEMQINVDSGDHDARRFYERHRFSNVENGQQLLFYFRDL